MATVSSHSLNGSDGTHAGGIPVRLVNLSTGETLFQSAMDAGGRLSETVDLSTANPDDRYEIVFETGVYWSAKDITHPRPVEEIVLRFRMPNPEARYHMPVILSPNSYTCWLSLPE